MKPTMNESDAVSRNKVELVLCAIFPHMTGIKEKVAALTEVQLGYLMVHFKHPDHLTPVLAARVFQAYKDVLKSQSNESKWKANIMPDRTGSLPNKPLRHITENITF